MGVVVAAQLLLWTASGLFMTSNAIETVRGTTLRRDVPPLDLRRAGPLLPPAAVLPPEAVLASPVESAELTSLLGAPVYRLSSGGRHWLVDARSGQERPIGRGEALAIARQQVVLVEPLTAIRVGDPPPLELRRPGGAWRVAAADGTHVYIGTAGEVMAVRTELWRWHDFAWGLHILDPAGREATHHPLLIASALLALASVVSGIILIAGRFGRRRPMSQRRPDPVR
ncbi:hypothetical protein IP88_15990 [alpha proteobacterium AAP81b]|nr:hypothetical protein IP88_15990 [alpha proteobacterium AAP81b]